MEGRPIAATVAAPGRSGGKAWSPTAAGAAPEGSAGREAGAVVGETLVTSIGAAVADGGARDVAASAALLVSTGESVLPGVGAGAKGATTARAAAMRMAIGRHQADSGSVLARRPDRIARSSTMALAPIWAQTTQATTASTLMTKWSSGRHRPLKAAPTVERDGTL